MESLQRSTRNHESRSWPTRLAVLVVLSVAAALNVPTAGAHLANESGIIQLDSATAVAEGQSPQNWRNADPLAVPDIFGPLSFATVQGYDFHGAWEPTTNHQSNLYTSPSDPSPVSQLIVVVANLVEPAGAGLGFAVMVGAASEFGAGSGTVASEERLQPPARARARRRLPIGTPRTENVKR